MIIGLCGNAGCGKSRIANELLYRLVTPPVLRKSIIMSLAQPLKELARKHFGWDGKKDNKGRRLLQVLGTEAGREYNQDLWVNKLDTRINNVSKDTIVMVDDVRFDNEVEYIEAKGGMVFYIKRGKKRSDNHISENGIDYRKHKINIVDNNGDINDAVEVIFNAITFSN